MNQKRRGVLATLGLAVVAMLALGGLATGAQAAQTHIDGKTFAELGVKQESFVSEGTFKWVTPEWGITMICDEKGNGVLGANGATKHNVTLTNCDFYDNDSGEPNGCVQSQPTTFNLYENWVFAMEECLWWGEFELVAPCGGGGLAITSEFGPEAVNLSATTTCSVRYGENDGYVSNSSTWTLVGDFTGEKFGIW